MTGLEAHVVVRLGPLALDAEVRAEPGETVVVVGPNGAGKSTLLRALAGLVTLDGGFVHVDGDAIERRSPDARPIGVVFQDGLLFQNMSVRDNVAFGLRARKARKREAHEIADALLARLGLAAYAAARPSELSGGQAQRVALARALAIKPRVLLLDEPLTGLDAGARVDVRRALTEHVATYEGVRVIVTHDPLEALTLADRILVLEAGRVTQVGRPDEVRNHPQSRYVAQLLGLNLLEGTLASASEFRLANGTTLQVAVDDIAVGRCVAIVEPSAVTLSTDAPHSSARNTWEMTVVELDHEPSRVRVRLDGPMQLIAEITPSAAGEMQLAAGAPVWCALKATAISLQPI